ncbi:MAG TPA: succinate dehydrogenase cytochrome b subunit [Bacteroidota bacterium]|nr:succinate dehydrogenase cytochrome b subunit [Bacteroidota bacterium]
MSKVSNFLTSSVGRKLMMGLSGLFLCSFLVVHLFINLFLFKQDGGATFDVYGEFMATYPLIRPLEWILFGGFLLHAFVGIWLWITNRQARPERYAVNRASENSTLASRIGFITGAFVLVFLVVHINTFFVKSRFFPDGRTMYEIVVQAFQSPVYVGFYVVALVFLAYHLRHGFQSAFQTLGIRFEKYQPLIDAVGVVFWLLIPLAFAALPLYFLWAH